MKRQIIHIDEDRCNGCGLCASACHEGAIAMVDGKAKLIRDDYCDGLGNCLPVCPTGAIRFVEREAAPFDEAAVKAAQAAKPAHCDPMDGCPGSRAHAIERPRQASAADAPSELNQWPVQIKLAPANAPYFRGADVLVAADCTAFACGSFHANFMKDRVTLIGCPKLDEGDYADKLTDILSLNDVRSLTVARMEVPCCGGIERAAQEAIARSGKDIPLSVSVLSVGGRLIANR
ncbi:ATP-binding protein [Bacillota bacterium Meth-B3]|nr:4Fe-4S binding protein [Christensenellaceae bacterium]MEA5066155.1 4Fe-4S binding protein [Eubacteriales bacterium]